MYLHKLRKEEKIIHSQSIRYFRPPGNNDQATPQQAESLLSDAEKQKLQRL